MPDKIRNYRHILASVVILLCVSLDSVLSAQSTAPRTIHFIHGQWFDGTRFLAKDLYSVDGILSKSRMQQHIDETVDLHNGYVIPPFGDAHEHNFDSVERTPAVTAQYLKDGIFYAQGMTDVLDGARAAAAANLVNTPSTVDVTYAHGGLTSINGHPKDVYESLALGFYYPSNEAQRQQVIASHLRAGQAYWEIDSPTDLTATWPGILATKPDLIKIYLTNTEHYTHENHVHPPLGGGLDPALVPLVVERAHAAGLKIAAHVDTAADVHVALLGGVDELAHMPGYCLDPKQATLPYRLFDADIAVASRKHVTIIPTASICDNDRVSSAMRTAIRTMQLDNLRRLKTAGVNIVIGSDSYGSDSLHEAQYLHSLGLWTNLELLRIWSITTPEDIVHKHSPTRRIAKLDPGYEASFLVLNGNPLLDWTATGEIDQRWKQGQPITPAPLPASKP